MHQKFRAVTILFASALLSFSYLNCTGGFKSLSNASSLSSLSAPTGSPGTVVSPTPAPVASDNSSEALPATSGTPLIHQIRAGVEIATYPNLSAIFTRVGGYRLYATGDIFELDPAIYSGQENQAWIGTQPLNATEGMASSSTWLVPTDLIIRGRVVNNYRPVIQLTDGVSGNTLGQGVLYLDNSKNITVENIDFNGLGNSVGKGGIYLNGADGFTLSHSRVTNFLESNGIFSTGNNVGTILFQNVETAFNGGDGGPEHNYYMGESNSDQYYDAAWGHRSDAGHTIIWRGCYSHDAYYGHTLKSRAQNNLVEGSWLQGKETQPGAQQGEAYLADFPNGGNVTVRDTILEKGYSGDNSNGLFVTYAMEGQLYPTASSIHITHNTFVARTKTYDSQGHYLQPLSFFYPNQSPTDAGFPVSNVVVDGNVFLGFETDPNIINSTSLYRGVDLLQSADLTLIDASYNLLSPTSATLSSIGELSPALPVGTVTRAKSTFGAKD